MTLLCGATGRLVERDILATLDLGDRVVPMDETARTFSVHLTSLEEFVRGTVASAS